LPESEALLRRSTFKILGAACVALGVTGAFLPVLPSTIFFILAAGCFARSSPHLEQKILDHPVFGPPVSAWRKHGAIPVNAKLYAVAGMSAGYALFYWMTAPATWSALAVAAGMLASAAFVVNRPSGPKPAENATSPESSEGASSNIGN